MKPAYVSQLQPNQTITAPFLVAAKEVRQKKNGEAYLSLQLTDRTGDIDAKMWENVAEVVDTFDRDDFVKVKGLTQVYNNKLQLTIHKLQRVGEDEIDFADYFPASERDPEEMFAELAGIIGGLGNPHLKALLEGVFADPEVARLYRKAPAAKFVHHAYLGGLIEHVLSLCRLCRLAASHYRSVDADLLLAGAILHDLGKIHELSYDRGFGYTTEGQLLGHITITLKMIHEKLRDLPDFPPKLRLLLEHMILSHHGQMEFGSPKVPLFPEALLLHYLDDMDSKMECMRALVAHDRQVEGEWTGYSAPLERAVLKKLKYLGDGSGEEARTEEAPVDGAAPVPPQIRPEAPSRKPRVPETRSLFGEKLLDALKQE